MRYGDTPPSACHMQPLQSTLGGRFISDASISPLCTPRFYKIYTFLGFTVRIGTDKNKWNHKWTGRFYTRTAPRRPHVLSSLIRLLTITYTLNTSLTYLFTICDYCTLKHIWELTYLSLIPEYVFKQLIGPMGFLL